MRPDIAVRVFKMKLDELMDDLLKKNVLGVSIGHTYVIEFQKRGLPHAHILIVLQATDKPRTVDIYDRIVCAELPNPNTQPRLRGTVTKQLLHGPCGPINPQCVCMDPVTRACGKSFPKEACLVTKASEGTYPVYRRRNNPAFFLFKKKSDGSFGPILDDTWVVPYNPYFAVKYDAHINIEICTSIAAVKYLFKYVYKGHSKASIALVPATVPGHQLQPANMAHPTK
jgi:hypothetical protein